MKLTTIIIKEYNNILLLCEVLIILTLSTSIILIVSSLDDYEQFIYWKIIYIHVPLATMSILIYMLKVIMSIINLIWQQPMMGIIAKQLAPVALTNQILCLITGSLWGKVSWGTYWEFDSRMTSMLILTLITLSYVIIDNVLSSSTEIMNWQRKERLLSVISITGGLFIPIIKYSVEWWSNLHQKSSFSLTNTGSEVVDSSIYLPLILMYIVLTLLTLIIVINKIITYQSERKQSIWENY